MLSLSQKYFFEGLMMVNDPRGKRRAALAPRRSRRHPMNKTGARLLGTFAAAFIAWLWDGWGAPFTGVKMSDGLLTSLGGGCIVVAEWVLVKEGRRA